MSQLKAHVLRHTNFVESINLINDRWILVNDQEAEEILSKCPTLEPPISLIPRDQRSMEAPLTQPSDTPTAQSPATPTQGAPVEETATVADQPPTVGETASRVNLNLTLKKLEDNVL